MSSSTILPPEILAIIFKNLSYQDKVNCRLCCKRWNLIISNLKEDCLIASNRILINEFWFYTNKIVDVKYQIFISSYNFLPTTQTIEIKSRFANLKKLLINFSTFEDDLDFSLLNQFKFLEQLQLARINLKQESTLELANLKTLSISTIANDKKLI